LRNRDVFACAERTSRATAKRRLPFDSACQIGLSTLSKDVLTVDQSVWRWRFENCEIGCVFNYCGTTSENTGKWRALLDSASQIGPETIFNGILSALGRCFLCRDVNEYGDGRVF
jgi:hypothetical protein